MSKCKNCSNDFALGYALGCRNCGARYCTDCAINTLKICPVCYYDLEPTDDL